MSDRSAVTNKGKDGKSKYSSLNLYDTYKGKSVEPQKQAVSHGRGLQSLGKVGNARRVPTPAILPSLRSEHKGNDPNINLVPNSGSGWGAEDKPESSGPSPAQTNPTAPIPQGPGVAPPQDDSQSGKSWHPPAPNAPLQGNQNVTTVPKRREPASQLDQEFPVLGMAGDQTQPPASGGKDSDSDKEKPKEVQYGPGPSLRPQNVKSWREGGSSLNKSGGTGTGEGEGAASGPGAALDKDRGAMMPPPGMAPPGIMNGAQGNAPPPGPMPQQFRGMMPPYMQFGPGPRGMPAGPGGPRGPHPMNPYPMGYPGPPPGPRPGFPPQHPGAMMQQPGPDHVPPRHRDKPRRDRDRDNSSQPAIVNVKHLSEMDELAAGKTEEGWAGASGEVDYSEKLVFSDEEDDTPKKRGDKGARHLAREAAKEGKDGRLEEDFNRRSPMTAEGGPQGPPRAAWEGNEPEGGAQPPMSRGPHPHHGRVGPGADQGGHQRPPVEDEDKMWNQQRQKQSSDMSTNIERARQRRLEEEKREEEQRRAAAAEKLRQLNERSAAQNQPRAENDGGEAPVAGSTVPPPGPPPAPREVQKKDSGHDLHAQENNEKEPENREREWERDRERHKERDVERDRDRDRDRERDRADVPYSREGMVIKRQRTESGSSDGSRQGRDRREGGNYARQPARNIPPRFLKQQQQQQEQQQHRRPPSFSSQDQPWHGREGSRGSWGSSGPTTPTTPPFGQEHRQFNPNTRMHIQRRRESSETSADGTERGGFPPEGKVALQEGDGASGQAAIPSRADQDDKGRGFRNQRIPTEGPPKEIPRRQDSHKEIPRAPRQEARPDQRPDQWQEHRQDHKQDPRMEQRQDHRAGQKQDHRSEQRPDQRVDQRQDSRPNQRVEYKSDQRREQRPGPRQDSRQDLQQEGRQESKLPSRQQSQESKLEPKPEQKSESWNAQLVEQPASRERHRPKSDETAVDTRQTAFFKSSTGQTIEAKSEMVTQAQEKREAREAPLVVDKEKKDSGPVAENKNYSAEPPKTAKTVSVSDRDRRPQRDSKAMPSSLVDMKSGSRDRNEKSERQDKGRRRESDRDDRNNRRGSAEQSGSRHAPSKQPDSRDRKREEGQAPEPSRAWKGGDTSQRLKLKEPSSATSLPSPDQCAAKIDSKPVSSVKSSETSKAEEQKPADETIVVKESRDINNDKGESEKGEERNGGTKPKDFSNERQRDRDRSSRERRDEKDGRGNRTSGRGKSLETNRRRDERGPPNRRQERGPPSDRRDRGRIDSAGSRGRGFKPYSAGVRGRGRGRGERFEARPTYRRPRQRDEEDKDWIESSGDESAERGPERREAPRQNKPNEVRDPSDGNVSSLLDEKSQVDKERLKDQEAKAGNVVPASEVDDPEKEGLDRRNLPKGEPSRRGRGGSVSRRGRGSSNRGGATREPGRDSYRDNREDHRPSASRDAYQRYERGPRNEGEARDNRDFKGRRREEEDRANQRDGAPGRGGYKNKRVKQVKPPRFQKNTTQGLGGRVRSARGERTPEGPGARPRESGEQNVASGAGIMNEVSKGTARPPLPRQNSSDLNNDEWETASESSNFDRQREKDVSQEGARNGGDKVPKENNGGNVRSSGNTDNKNRNDRSGRKGVSNQRQGSDRPGNRDRTDGTYDRREKNFRGNRDNRGPGSRGRGRGGDRRSDNGPIGKRSGPRGGSEQAQNHSDVYRLDHIVLDDQRIVQDALHACNMRPKRQTVSMGKPLDTTTPVTLPLQTKEKERPKPVVEKKIDVLATYDLNNSYGVVVVDDVPEVIVENPEELLTPDAGFQTVLTRKQKMQEAERKKQELSEMSKRNKVGAQTKRHVPPRFRSQSPLKEGGKEHGAVAPIGTGSRMGMLNKAPGTKPITSINTDNIPPLMGSLAPPVSIGKGVADSVTLPPPPPSNAWEKPPLLSGPQQQQQPAVAAASAAAVAVSAAKAVGAPGKPESSNDQHDSGVELNSDHHASNPPSQRSSPNGEAKAEARLVSELMSAVGQQPKHSPLASQADWSADMPPPSRLTGVGLQSVSEVAVSSHGQSYVPMSGGMMGRMDATGNQPDTSSMHNISVDLATSSGVIGPNSLLAQSVPPRGSPSGRPGQSSMIQTAQDQARSNVQSPTSTAATDELSMKIERAKNLWDEQEDTAPAQASPHTSLSNGSMSSLQPVTSVEGQQQHIARGDKSHDMGSLGDLSSGHLVHPATSMMPVSGASDITFGSFASSNVELVENDAPTSVSFNNLNANMSGNMDSDDMEMSVPSSRAFSQFSSANTEVESPPQAFTSAGYSTKGLSLHSPATTASAFASGALLQSSMLSQSAYDNKHIRGSLSFPQHQQQQQQSQQQEQAYPQSVLLAQPFGLGSSLSNNLAGSAVGIQGGSVGGSIGGTSQSMLSQGTSGQYSFQGHDTSRLLPGTPAFLNPVSFQGTIIQPQSGSLQFGLNQNTGLTPSSPAPGALPSQQTQQSYQQAAAAGFLPAQTPQPAPLNQSGLPTNFQPVLSVSLSQQPHVQSHSYMSLSSPSYTRPSHDLGLSSGLSSSVIMKPQSTMGGITKTVSSVAYGSVSSVPAVQPSHMFSQQRPTTQLGAQQPGMMSTNALIAAMQPTQAVAAPTHHPTQGQHSSFFSGGAQVAAAAAANSQVGSTNFFNTLGGNRSSNLQAASVQAIQPVPIQMPQSTLSSQYPMAAQQSQTTQPIVHPIGAPLGSYVNTYGDIGTQPKQLQRNMHSAFGMERQSSGSVLDMTSDLLSRGIDASASRSSNLSQHVDAKPFSPNRQTSSASATHGGYKSPDDKFGMYTSRSTNYKSHEQGMASKPTGYSALSIGHYGTEERKTYTQPRSTAPEIPMPVVADTSKLTESAAMMSSSSPKPSSLPFCVSTTTVTMSSASFSQKSMFTQASKVGQPRQALATHKQSPPAPKMTTASPTATALPPQSLPPRAFAPRTGSNNPRMPPQMFSQPNAQMMSHMMGLHGQQMRYPPPFTQGPPPVRGAQFVQPPRLPSTATGLSLSTGSSPPNPQQQTNLPSQQKSSHAATSKRQVPPQTSSTSQPTTTPSSKPSSGGGYQGSKGKSMQGLPGPGKLSKAPSRFAKRNPIDLKMTPEELKAAKSKEREKLLASAKAFFSKPGSTEGDPKEKSEKSEK